MFRTGTMTMSDKIQSEAGIKGGKLLGITRTQHDEVQSRHEIF